MQYRVCTARHGGEEEKVVVQVAKREVGGEDTGTIVSTCMAPTGQGTAFARSSTAWQGDCVSKAGAQCWLAGYLAGWLANQTKPNRSSAEAPPPKRGTLTRQTWGSSGATLDRIEASRGRAGC